MIRLLEPMYKRIRDCFSQRPNLATWRMTAIVFVVYATFAWAFGFGTGLYRLEPAIDGDLLRVALIALILPALGEELFFRAALIPTKGQSPDAWWRMGFALFLFLIWHPINAYLFFKTSLTLFSDWRFLTVTGWLGIACTYVWRSTGSIWPPVAIHWLAVVIWKGMLGAPRLM